MTYKIVSDNNLELCSKKGKALIRESVSINRPFKSSVFDVFAAGFDHFGEFNRKTYLAGFFDLDKYWNKISEMFKETGSMIKVIEYNYDSLLKISAKQAQDLYELKCRAPRYEGRNALLVDGLKESFEMSNGPDYVALGMLVGMVTMLHKIDPQKYEPELINMFKVLEREIIDLDLSYKDNAYLFQVLSFYSEINQLGESEILKQKEPKDVIDDIVTIVKDNGISDVLVMVIKYYWDLDDGTVLQKALPELKRALLAELDARYEKNAWDEALVSPMYLMLLLFGNDFEFLVSDNSKLKDAIEKIYKDASRIYPEVDFTNTKELRTKILETDKQVKNTLANFKIGWPAKVTMDNCAPEVELLSRHSFCTAMYVVGELKTLFLYLQQNTELKETNDINQAYADFIGCVEHHEFNDKYSVFSQLNFFHFFPFIVEEKEALNDYHQIWFTELMRVNKDNPLNQAKTIVLFSDAYGVDKDKDFRNLITKRLLNYRDLNKIESLHLQALMVLAQSKYLRRIVVQKIVKFLPNDFLISALYSPNKVKKSLDFVNSLLDNLRYFDDLSPTQQDLYRGFFNTDRGDIIDIELDKLRHKVYRNKIILEEEAAIKEELIAKELNDGIKADRIARESLLEIIKQEKITQTALEVRQKAVQFKSLLNIQIPNWEERVQTINSKIKEVGEDGEIETRKQLLHDKKSILVNLKKELDNGIELMDDFKKEHRINYFIVNGEVAIFEEVLEETNLCREGIELKLENKEESILMTILEIEEEIEGINNILVSVNAKIRAAVRKAETAEKNAKKIKTNAVSELQIKILEMDPDAQDETSVDKVDRLIAELQADFDLEDLPKEEFVIDIKNDPENPISQFFNSVLVIRTDHIATLDFDTDFGPVTGWINEDGVLTLEVPEGVPKDLITAQIAKMLLPYFNKNSGFQLVLKTDRKQITLKPYSQKRLQRIAHMFQNNYPNRYLYTFRLAGKSLDESGEIEEMFMNYGYVFEKIRNDANDSFILEPLDVFHPDPNKRESAMASIKEKGHQHFIRVMENPIFFPRTKQKTVGHRVEAYIQWKYKPETDEELNMIIDSLKDGTLKDPRIHIDPADEYGINFGQKKIDVRDKDGKVLIYRALLKSVTLPHIKIRSL